MPQPPPLRPRPSPPSTPEEEECLLPGKPTTSWSSSGRPSVWRSLRREAEIGRLPRRASLKAAPGILGVSDFEYWYPTVTAFSFRRTCAYWCAVFFAEGCLLFIWVPVFVLYGHASDNPSLLYSLTKVPSLVGGTFFLFGCYVGYFELVNMGSDFDKGRLHFLWCDWGELHTRLRFEVSSIIGLVVYLVGALFYQVALTADLFELDESLMCNLVEWPFVWGGFLFFVGGGCEVHHNRCYETCPVTAVWWVSVLNLLGGFCFWISACPSVVKGSTATLVGTAGTAAYYIGSVLSLYMWRGEQFGLSLISALNDCQRDDTQMVVHVDASSNETKVCLRRSVRSISELDESGDDPKELKEEIKPAVQSTAETAAKGVDGNWKDVIEPKLSCRGLFFLNVYIIVASLQVLTCCASLAHTQRDLPHPAIFGHRMNAFLQGIINVFAVHMVLVLHSVCVRMPTELPYKLLVKGMRFLAILSFLNSFLSTELFFEDVIP